MKNKRGFGGLVALMAAMVVTVLIMAGSFSLQVQAETTGKVTATSANVRKDADKNSDAVGGLLKNDSFVVKGQKTGADGKVWYLITFGNNVEGYVRSDLVSVDGDVDTIPGSTGSTVTQAGSVTKLNPVSGTVLGKTVNVRAGAGADNQKVSSVNKGDVVTIIGQATGSDDKVWYQVTFISNNKEVTGFIRSDYVDPAGSLTPYKEPVNEPEPSVPDEPDEPVEQEPVEEEPTVEVNKDWDTVKIDEKWMLVENASGKYYSVNDLIQISKENAVKLEAANGTIGGQKAAIVILVILLVVLLAGVAFIVFRYKDLIMEEILGMKDEPAPRRPEAQRRPAPQGQRPAQRPAGAPQGTRPAGAPQGARPVGAPQGTRPAGAPQGARPAGAPQGARPAGAPQGARPAGAPQGARPAGAPQGQRPAGAPQGQRPVGVAGGAESVGTTPAQKPKTVSVDGLAPVFDMKDTKEQIRKETNRSIENQQMESKVALNDNAKKPKNFMADEDEFEFEFLNWDGDDEE